MTADDLARQMRLAHQIMDEDKDILAALASTRSCCHKTRLLGAPCPLGWECPYDNRLLSSAPNVWPGGMPWPRPPIWERVDNSEQS